MYVCIYDSADEESAEEEDAIMDRIIEENFKNCIKELKISTQL